MKSFDQSLSDAQRNATGLREQSAKAASALNARVTQLSQQLGAIKSAVSVARISLREISALTRGVDEQIVNTQNVLDQVQGDLNGLSTTGQIVHSGPGSQNRCGRAGNRPPDRHFENSYRPGFN